MIEMLIRDKEQKEKNEMTACTSLFNTNCYAFRFYREKFTTTNCLFLPLQQNLSLWQEDPITL